MAPWGFHKAAFGFTGLSKESFIKLSEGFKQRKFLSLRPEESPPWVFWGAMTIFGGASNYLFGGLPMTFFCGTKKHFLRLANGPD